MKKIDSDEKEYINKYSTIYGIVCIIYSFTTKKYQIKLDSYNTSSIRWNIYDLHNFNSIIDAEEYIIKKEVNEYEKILKTFNDCNIKETLIMSKI